MLYSHYLLDSGETNVDTIDHSWLEINPSQLYFSILSGYFVKSRSGFLIMVNCCPVMWLSKLQTEIVTSAMQAEYIALSTACRDVIPLTRLIKEVTTFCNLEGLDLPTLKTTIYKDNEGALKLTNTELPRMTNDSKIKTLWSKISLVLPPCTVRRT